MSESREPIKGRLTILNGARNAQGGPSFREFSLNPNDLRDSHGFKYPGFDIPGNSHPALQAGQGTNRVISFTLRLDALVGSNYQKVLSDFDEVRGQGQTEERERILSVADEIRWYESLTLTNGNARLGLTDSQPPIVLFSFGRLYRALPCVVEKRDISVNMWSTTLEPVRADISLQLIQKIDSSVARGDVYDDRTGRGRYD